jgi:hypothetical protein
VEIQASGWFGGGLVGENFGGAITNSYATGNVTLVGGGHDRVGGLVGSNYGSVLLDGITYDSTITNCYSTGRVSGYSYVGGLVGYNLGTITSSYWDTETSGQSTSAGGIGKTTAEMMQKSTFANWDFVNIWAIKEGVSYPYFSYALVIAAHADVTAEATSPAGAVVNYVLPTATDNYGASVIVTCTPASGSTFALGDTTVTCNAEDTAGNHATQTSFIVHVVDTTPPVPDVASLPTNSDQCSIKITTIPTATDICDGKIIGTTNDPLQYTNQGAYTIHWTYTDKAGNVSTQNQSVFIKDTIAPTINVSAPECVTYGKGNGNKANKITVTGQDNCSKNVIPQITKVEVFNNGGNLVTGNGIYEISGNTVYVNPNGNGWSVRITVIAADENGNTQTIPITKSLIKC